MNLTAVDTEKNFVQPKITGYRQLSEPEVALMNEGKALAEQCRVFTEKCKTARFPTENGGVDPRWLALGVTDLQKGFMSVIRSIAQPTTF